MRNFVLFSFLINFISFSEVLTNSFIYDDYDTANDTPATWLYNSPLFRMIGKDYQRQLTKTTIFSNNELNALTFDYIIIGSGPAGCVLANRLTEDPSQTVLLLEAGSEALPLITDVPMSAPNLQSTGYNWGYATEEQPSACLSMKGHKCLWPHGRGLGGSSLINYMLYTRGNRRDFDRWNETSPGWSYDDVLPYFKKSEGARMQFDSKYHGHSGPLIVEEIIYKSGIAKAFIDSSKQAGYPLVDFNGNEQLGVSYMQMTTNRGHRVTAPQAFLNPIRKRTNLNVLTNAWATKIITSNGKAIGVEFLKHKKRNSVKARKEVILTAGAFETPKLLMLSGIGPANDLTAANISVVKDLPVGRTLYEHIGVFGPLFTIENDTDGLVSQNNVLRPDVIAKWFKGSGPLTSTGIEGVLYFKSNVSTDPDPQYPDVELLQSFTTMAFDTASGTRAGVGISEEAFNSVFRPLQKKRSFQYVPLLIHPRSKGELRLKSSNPFHHPIFRPNFFSDPQDTETLLAGIREAIRITNQPAFKSIGARLYEAKVPGCLDLEFNSDDYWRCYIHHLSATLHHQIATCKMGPPTDPAAVVDNELRVHGFTNLRVADISVVPIPPSGHTVAISYMLGERAADLIKLNNIRRKRDFSRLKRRKRSPSKSKITREINDMTTCINDKLLNIEKHFMKLLTKALNKKSKSQKSKKSKKSKKQRSGFHDNYINDSLDVDDETIEKSKDIDENLKTRRNNNSKQVNDDIDDDLITTDFADQLKQINKLLNDYNVPKE